MLGGNTQFYKPTAEVIKFWRHTSRTSFGVRGQTQFIAPVGDTKTLPIFEKLFLGGEYSVRGFDIRSIGPSDPTTGLVLGGNKSLLFNAEYMVSIVSQVRLILFYDAGQVADERQSFALDKFRTSTGAEVRFFMPVLNVPFRLIFAVEPAAGRRARQQPAAGEETSCSGSRSGRRSSCRFGKSRDSSVWMVAVGPHQRPPIMKG